MPKLCFKMHMMLKMGSSLVLHMLCM